MGHLLSAALKSAMSHCELGDNGGSVGSKARNQDSPDDTAVRDALSCLRTSLTARLKKGGALLALPSWKSHVDYFLEALRVWLLLL
jgi:hypothetical protein